MSESPDNRYCEEQVRLFDRDRYLTALFAPPDRRPDLFALYAFNHEIAKVGEVVSEAMLGHIRLQWWREALDEIYTGTPRKHLVVEALATAIGRHDLPRALFDHLINSREQDLAEEGPQDLEQWLDYAAASSSTLVFLALHVLGVVEDDAHQAGLHVGVAWSLVGLLRASKVRAEKGQITLPVEVPDADGVIWQIPAVAAEHLRAARQLHRHVPKTAVPALLPAALASRYLGRLISSSSVDPNRVKPLDHVILYGRALTGRY